MSSHHIHDRVLQSDSFNLSLVTMFVIVMIPSMAFIRPVEPENYEIWTVSFIFWMIWISGSWALLVWLKRRRPKQTTMVQSRAHIMFRTVNAITPLTCLVLISLDGDWSFYMGLVLFFNSVISLSLFMNIITEEWKAAAAAVSVEKKQ